MSPHIKWPYWVFFYGLLGIVVQVPVFIEVSKSFHLPIYLAEIIGYNLHVNNFYGRSNTMTVLTQMVQIKPNKFIWQVRPMV